jgi:arginine repressor
VAAALQSRVVAWPRRSEREHELIPLSPREVLTAVHRSKNALVNIEGKPHGGKWRALATMSVAELLSDPTIAPFLTGPQVYFSLASVFASRYSYPSKITGLQVRSRENLSHLNVVAVDLDIAHDTEAQFNFNRTVQEVLDFTVRASLPFPSIVSNSGRGCWLFWLLRDRRNATEPLGAFPNLQAIHKRILRAVVSTYRDFGAGADSSCTDSQRVARFPGSVNADSRTVVTYYRTSDRIYTLPEIASAFGVKPQKTEISAGIPREKSARHVEPGYCRWRRPLAGLRQLAEIRGQFRKGQRHTACYLFAVLARRARVANLELEVFAFACRHCPGLDHAAIRKCLASAGKSYLHITNATIIRMLQISDTERARLTNWLKPAKPSKAAQLAYRRSILAAEVELRGSVSVRQAVKALSEHGIKVGRSQVAIDLKSMNKTQAVNFSKGVRKSSLVCRSTTTGTSVENRTASKKLTRRESRPKKAEIAARRAAILDLEQDGHSTTRQMAQLLKPRGFFVSHEIVSRDYKALGIMGPRTPRRGKRELWPNVAETAESLGDDELVLDQSEPELGEVLPTLSLNANRNEPEDDLQEAIFGIPQERKEARKVVKGLRGTAREQYG